MIIQRCNKERTLNMEYPQPHTKENDPITVDIDISLLVTKVKLCKIKLLKKLFTLEIRKDKDSMKHTLVTQKLQGIHLVIIR
jgi:hypothetical protein